MNELTFGSLFAGVGGFDLGFEAAGWQCKFQVEWDKHCQQILARHWPDVPRWSDVSDVDGKELPPVDCINFGSPCQDLSVAGRRAGLEGDRSNLFFEATRIIREMRDATGNQYPRVAVWENVPGALNSNKGADFSAVLDSLADSGALAIEWAVLDAQHFGVPQRRRRIFLIAVLDPAIARNCPDPLFPVAKGHKRNTGKTGEAGVFYSTHGIYDRFLYDISPPLKTVAVICVASKTVAPRKLTPIEHERLMGWPDDHTRYKADGTEQADSHRYKQCGNGVAAPVAQWVAQQLRRIINANQ